MKSVILGRNDEIIGLLHSAGLREVEVAGAVAADGSPVNRKTYRVSASKRNLERARRSDAGYATRHEHRGLVFYTLT